MPDIASYSRTKKSIRNSIVAVSLQIISLLIGFWSRRIFLNHLGTEILGLNTTAASILQFLNLAELGIGSAVSITLYKPIFDNDKQAIKEIIALQGWLYRIIALIIIAASSIIMCFFPLIFSKEALPIWYSYASFGVLLYSSLLGYFFNYKQIILDSHQLNYKTQYIYKSVSIIKLIAQLLTVKYLQNGYLWWLALEIIAATSTSILLSIKIEKEFPFIKEKVPNPSSLRKKYKDVVTKVKLIFIHRINNVVIAQITPIILYAIAGFTLVAKYGNYLIFTNNITAILAACIMGLEASVGNMIAEGNANLITKVFRELFSFRYWITGVCCICLWFLVEPFISVWIGPEYLLGKSTLFLIILIFSIANSRSVIDTYLHSLGMYQDIWAPVAETVTTVCFSLILGRKLGLNGILAGVLISQILIVKIWKPLFLFKWGFKISILYYIKIYTKHIMAWLVAFVVIYLITSQISLNPSSSFLNFFIYATIVFATSAVTLFVILHMSESGMRGFIKRIIITLKS